MLRLSLRGSAWPRPRLLPTDGPLDEGGDVLKTVDQESWELRLFCSPFPYGIELEMPKFASRFQPILILVVLIWAVELVNFFLGHRLASWGISPRSMSGLIGIPLAPMLHAGFWHTVSNTAPLFFLGALTLAGGKRRFWVTTVSVTLLSGALVWLFARNASHVGASGLVFGYFGAILARAVIDRSLSAVAIGVVTVMAYGGLIWGILPLRSYVSFESHLFGLIAGVLVVWLGEKFNRPKSPT